MDDAILTLRTFGQLRAIWDFRPELREVYYEWFEMLMKSVYRGVRPIVEIGTGPGFFKEHSSKSIATDCIWAPWLDVVCDASSLPFKSRSIAGIVMLDTLHHLPGPISFMAEASRVLRPRGRLAVIEPWITPFSFLIYRFFHHEKCSLGVDLVSPFGKEKKDILDGNASILFEIVKRVWIPNFSLIKVEPFVALPHLLSFGFKVSWSMPRWPIRFARIVEPWLHFARSLLATRALIVWEVK